MPSGPSGGSSRRPPEELLGEGTGPAFAEDGGEYLLAALEVEVDGALGDASPAGYLVDGGAVKTACAERLDGGVDDGLAFVRAGRTGLPHWLRRHGGHRAC